MHPPATWAFQLIPRKTFLLVQSVASPKLSFVHKNPGHDFDKPCLCLTLACLDVAQAAASGGTSRSVFDASQAEFQQLSPHRSAGKAGHFFLPCAATKKLIKQLAAGFLTVTNSHKLTESCGTLHCCSGFPHCDIAGPGCHSVLPSWHCLFTSLCGWEESERGIKPSFSSISGRLFSSM